MSPSTGSRALSENQLTTKLAQIRASMTLEPRFDDYYLARFLRARKGDVPKTIKMLKAHFQWRKEKQIDKLYYDHMHNPEPFAEESDLIRVYPSGYWGLDNAQRVVYYERIGIAEYKKVMDVCSRERYLEFFTYQYEKLIWTRFTALRPEVPDVYGHREQTLNFVDLKGLSWDHLSSATRSLFRDISSIASDHYPDIMGITFIVNAPRIFSFIWSGLKGFVDVDTRNKIKVLSAGKKTNELVDLHIQHELLPDFLGGRVRGIKGVVDYGPWNAQEELVHPPRPSPAAYGFGHPSVSNETFVTCVEDEIQDTTTCFACAGCWSWWSYLRFTPPCPPHGQEQLLPAEKIY